MRVTTDQHAHRRTHRADVRTEIEDVGDKEHGHDRKCQLCSVVLANIRQYYGAKLAFPIMAMLFISNVFNLGADISAMGAAVRMLIGGNAHIYALLLTLASLMLQVFVPYH